jgi:hypothetical protein
MCDPSITLEQLKDPSLFDKLNQNSADYVVGEIVYMYARPYGVACQEVIDIAPFHVKFRCLHSQSGYGESEERWLGKSRIHELLYRPKNFQNRKEYLKVLEGTAPSNKSIQRYLRSPDNMREISKYLGGKKYKRTNKTKRKKRTKRRQTRRKG